MKMAPLQADPFYPTTEVSVWSVRLTAPDEAIARADSVLSPEERDRAHRFRVERARTEFILARAALRTLLGRYLNRPPESVAFAYGERGKPFLPDGALQFNMSHSAGFAAYAFTSGCEVGIDIERIRPMRDLEAIAERFFAPAETRDVLQLEGKDRESAFFRCWTRKEAYIKAVGAGLSLPLAGFRVAVLPSESPALLTILGDDAEASAWTLREFRPAEGYTGAVAFRDRGRSVRVHPVMAAAEL